MSRSVNFVLSIIGLVLFFETYANAQSENAIFHIQVYKSDSTIIQNGTGFFMDGNHGYSQALVFKNGSYALAITKDNSTHRINKINGVDPETGLVRFELDNMLSAKITKLESATAMSSEGSSIKVIYSDGAQSTKSLSKKIVKKSDIVGFGQVVSRRKP